MPYIPPHLRTPEQKAEAEKQRKLAEEIRTGKMVVVGLDQWVNIRKIRFTKLCTSGILGCVGLVLESPNFICATHIFDGFEKNWDAYRHQLDLPIAVMGNVTQATLVISSKIKPIMAREKLLREWLISQNINTAETLLGNGFIVRKTMTGAWNIDLKDPSNRFQFLSQSNIVASESGPYVDNWGKLSHHAADSGV